MFFRYGQPAGTLTGDTLTTVGNVYTISHNARIMTPKGLVKRTAADAGQAVVYGYTTSCKASTSYNNLGGHTDSDSSVTKYDKNDKDDNYDKKDSL